MSNVTEKMPDMIFVLGPTASGKTGLACELALDLGGEVISCDSMQVYRGMSTLTQAPPEQLTAKVRHHLVGFLDPVEEYSAARFAKDAERIAKKLISRGSKAVFAGGTGLYVKAFIDGIFDAPGRSEGLRRKLRCQAERHGKSFLYERLKVVDPHTAGRLHPNDLKRVIRALEIYELSGKTKYELSLDQQRRRDGNFRMFALDMPREELYERIESRVDEMIASGAIEELKRLRKNGLGPTAAKALGVEELGAYLDGDLSLPEAAELLKKNTRNYAKRQLTWFKGDRRIEWIDSSSGPHRAVEEILTILRTRT